MSDTKDNALAVWTPSDVVTIPKEIVSPTDIARYGSATLSKRDVASIVAGFNANSFEMVSTFVWTKAAAALKKQVASLGMEFVGEMLRRPDLTDDSDPATSLSDYEAIALAEDLGMVTPTQGLRLKHAMQLVAHFANLDQPQADEEEMQETEATNILRTCVTSILGKARFDAAIQFADFRNALRSRTLKADDGEVLALKGSPYFFIRTTVSVLLSEMKTGKGAQLEHVVGNTMLLVPIFWDRFRDPERWQIAQTFAEVSASGNRLATAGLQKALQDVHGFDFVPESLRSNTFTEAAARVLSAHFSFNNFFNEKEPMQTLADLGTTIPKPAFSKTMEATMAVTLGNYYGHSWTAQDAARKVLKGLRLAQWEYYLNECLPSDRTVLDKLCSEPKPAKRWYEVIEEFCGAITDFSNRSVAKLIDASRAEDVTAIAREAYSLRSKMLAR